MNDFDNAGTGFVGASNNGGAVPAVLGGGPSGNFLLLTPDGVGGLLNTVAFDQTDPGSVVQNIAFGFQLPDEASHSGCCGQRADGFSVAVIDSNTYGPSGALPVGTTNWERPQFANSIAVGFDIFEGNNDTVYSINVNGSQAATATINDSVLQLTNNIPKNAVLSFDVDTSGGVPRTRVTMQIQELNGGPTVTVFDNVEVLGAPPVGGRLAFGARTGGAWTAVGLDNVQAAFAPSAPIEAIPSGLLAPAEDGTVHLYQLDGVGRTWADAELFAGSQTFRGANGHLVSITSDGENTFVANNVGTGDRWIGLTDNENFGGTEAGSNPNGGWVWENGEAFNYQNFAPGEPNNSGGEDAAHLRGDGLWNDNASGLPGDRGGPPAFASVVEFDTGVALPRIEEADRGFDVNFVGTPGGFNTAQARDWLDMNPGTFVVTAQTIDYVDPESGAGANFPQNTPFPIDTPADDNNFAMRATTNIWIPFEGVWSFGVNSDDGFALSIDGADLEFVTNGQNIDGDLVFPDPRGSADTIGVFSFAGPGFYDLTLDWFENGGGASVELFSAFGAHTSFNPNVFRLVGDFENGGLLALTTAPVPEPATGLLGLLGVAALGLRRRRQAA